MQRAAEWLNTDVNEVFAVKLEGLGHGSVTGATRSKIVEGVEKTRALVLNKALEEIRPTSTRAAWSWRQRDKISSAWLLALPGGDTNLTSAEFSEASAANLCLPSPACSSKVGETIRGSVKVDSFGDNVQATCVQGDHWRTRHNQILHLLYRLCMWSGLPVEMKVFNLFAGLIRQEGLSRVEQVRQCHSIVPDMRITMGGAGGALGGSPGVMAKPVLHEISHIMQPYTLQTKLDNW